MNALKLLNPCLLWRILRAERRLIVQLARRQIAVRYRGAVLGYFWSFSHPLLMLAVYTFVFGVVFKARWGLENGDGTASFAVMMFCGMAVFNIFSETLNGCATVVLHNVNFVKKIIFPLEILPIVQLMSTMLLGMVWFALVLAGGLVLGLPLSWTVLFFPILLVPLMLFSLGLGFFAASVTVYYRDMPHMLGIFTNILFFMTPIFYPASQVPERLRWVLQCNPLTALVTQARKILLLGQLPDWHICVLLWIVALTVCQLGLAWFLKTKKGFADVL